MPGPPQAGAPRATAPPAAGDGWPDRTRPGRMPPLARSRAVRPAVTRRRCNRRTDDYRGGQGWTSPRRCPHGTRAPRGRARAAAAVARELAEENRRLHDENGRGDGRAPACSGCGSRPATAGTSRTSRTLVDVIAQLARGDGPTALDRLGLGDLRLDGRRCSPTRCRTRSSPPPTSGSAACSARPPRRTPRDGGMVVNGQWRFISGAAHSHWQEIVAMAPTPDGTHDAGALAWCPMATCEIVDDWYTAGMRGRAASRPSPRTSSCPGAGAADAGRCSRASTPRSSTRSPIYRVPLMARRLRVLRSAPWSGWPGPPRRRSSSGCPAGRSPTPTTGPGQAPITHLQVAEADDASATRRSSTATGSAGPVDGKGRPRRARGRSRSGSGPARDRARLPAGQAGRGHADTGQRRFVGLLRTCRSSGSTGRADAQPARPDAPDQTNFETLRPGAVRPGAEQLLHLTPGPAAAPGDAGCRPGSVPAALMSRRRAGTRRGGVDVRLCNRRGGIRGLRAGRATERGSRCPGLPRRGRPGGHRRRTCTSRRRSASCSAPSSTGTTTPPRSRLRPPPDLPAPRPGAGRHQLDQHDDLRPRQPADYDGWDQPGLELRRAAAVLQARGGQRARRAAYHGAGGPLRGLRRPVPQPESAAFVAAAQQAGFAANEDFNGAQQDGFGFFQLTQREAGGPAPPPPSCTPRSTGPNLDRRDRQAPGAPGAHRGRPGGRRRGPRLGEEIEIRAEREVVLSAGRTTRRSC